MTDREKWLEENSEAFKRQAEWHETHDHPLADILTDVARGTPDRPIPRTR